MLQRLKVTGLVQNIGDTAGHAGREVAAGLAEHDHETAGHVFAAMVADAFDNRDGARVAHGKALARDTAEVAFTLDRTVEHGVADDDRVLPERSPSSPAGAR
jgi:hypothetical protein